MYQIMVWLGCWSIALPTTSSLAGIKICAVIAIEKLKEIGNASSYIKLVIEL